MGQLKSLAAHPIIPLKCTWPKTIWASPMLLLKAKRRQPKGLSRFLLLPVQEVALRLPTLTPLCWCGSRDQRGGCPGPMKFFWLKQLASKAQICLLVLCQGGRLSFYPFPALFEARSFGSERGLLSQLPEHCPSWGHLLQSKAGLLLGSWELKVDYWGWFSKMARHCSFWKIFKGIWSVERTGERMC